VKKRPPGAGELNLDAQCIAANIEINLMANLNLIMRTIQPLRNINLTGTRKDQNKFYEERERGLKPGPGERAHTSSSSSRCSTMGLPVRSPLWDVPIGRSWGSPKWSFLNETWIPE
jgi:hypothetical protein